MDGALSSLELSDRDAARLGYYVKLYGFVDSELGPIAAKYHSTMATGRLCLCAAAAALYMLVAGDTGTDGSSPSIDGFILGAVFVAALVGSFPYLGVISPYREATRAQQAVVEELESFGVWARYDDSGKPFIYCPRQPHQKYQIEPILQAFDASPYKGMMFPSLSNLASGWDLPEPKPSREGR